MKGIALILAVVVCSAVASDSYRRPIPFPAPSKGFTPPDLTCVCVRAPCPCPQCRPLPTCPKNCELFGGWVVGPDGCNTCQCQNDVTPGCPDVLCKKSCAGQGGYKVNKNGCQTCQCKKPSCRVQAICARFCEFGFARDEDGCVKGCQCNPAPCLTTRPTCEIFCLHGFAKDRNGCYTGCTCAPPPVITIRPPTTKVCRDGPLCRRFCPHGYAKDERGCTLPCTCNPAPTTPSPPTLCLDRMLCKKFCPFGPARDERGCVLPCTCNPRPVGRCPTLPPNSFGTCVEACGLNGGCQPGFLCCSNGCGHTCQRAVVDTPNQKPGECPRLRSSFSSSSLSSKKSLRLSCEGDDFKCPGAQKCCPLRFNTDVCVNPISVKPTIPTIPIGPRPY